MGEQNKFIEYGDIYYHTGLRVLSRAGEKLALRPQSLKVFLLLAENAGRVVSKEEIFLKVWQDISVTDDSLVQCIAEIRKALKDKPRQILKTIPKQGYLFTCPPSPVNAVPDDLLPFIGRTDELTQLEGMLDDPACRLVVIMGFGGVGKSRLSQALHKRLVQNECYAQGVIFVSLATLQNAELIPAAIAEVMGVSLQGLRQPAELLAEAIHQQNLLLILDNIEHLLPNVEVCQHLLANCPNLNILVTSRLPVQIYGEWIYPLDGFSLPDTSQQFAESAACQLFIQTARRIKHDFALTETDQSVVLKICRVLGGMPLGIEIAARWVQHLSCEEILEEMKHYLLSMQHQHGNEGDAGSLGIVLQQSWEMLTIREQDIMQTLALFRGAFTRESASAIAGAELGDYAGLINKSMLMRNADGRYALHEVMRRHANERRVMGGNPLLTRRFFEYHLTLAEQADADMLGGQQFSNIVRLNAEHDNFRECLMLCHPARSGRVSDQQLGMKLASALGLFWFLANHWKEGRQWAMDFLDNHSGSSPSSTLATTLLTAGGLSVLLDDYQIADKHLAVGNEMAAQYGSTVQWARGLAVQGVLRRLQGRFDDAIACGQQSMDLFELAGDQGGYQFNLGNLGHSLLVNGVYDEGVEVLEKCIRLNQQIGPTISLPYALVNLGRLHWKLRQQEAARLYLQQAIAAADKMGIILYRAQALCTLGWIKIHEGRMAEAQGFFQRSAADYLRLGEREGLADVMKGMAVVKTNINELPLAIQFLTVADTLIEDWQVPVSSDHHILLKDTRHCLQHGLKPEEQALYRNLGLATSPEELFRAGV